MEPVTFSFNGKQYVGFEADAVDAICGTFRDLIRDMTTLPRTPSAEQSEAARERPAPVERRRTYAPPPQNSAVVTTPTPLKAPRPCVRDSSSARTASARKNDISDPDSSSAASSTDSSRFSANGLSGRILDALKALGEGDIAAILAWLELQKFSFASEDPERSIANSLYMTLRNKVERIGGKRGYWRLVQ
jgi:hypothetical protein